jgi:glycosyltransferase involved in cell wall biosynthesis
MKPLQSVVFINSHPIQYFAPLYRELAAEPDMDLTVLYCSRHGLEGETDREFGVKVKWDIPVLEGYRSVFLKNHAFGKAGIYHFSGLLNLGVIAYLKNAPKGVVVVHGWGYLTNLLALVAGRLFGHTVCLRGESPVSHERSRSARSLLLRKIVFGKLLFRLPHHFFYIGEQNKAFYKMYGVEDSKLSFAPYAVDNSRFSDQYNQLLPHRNQIREALGVPTGKRVVLFSGKYIDKKRPLDLLRAFLRFRNRDEAFLIMMGEGELRGEMENIIRQHSLQNVLLTGFVNQSKVAEYYTAADLFAMCSGEGETWGLSANEAMNFHLPVLLSDLTGSSSDLVRAGANGLVFSTGDIGALASGLDHLLSLPEEKLREMGAASARIVQGYSYREISQAIRQLFRSRQAGPGAEATLRAREVKNQITTHL